MLPPRGPVSATFFDGETAARQDVDVTVDERLPITLVISGRIKRRWLLTEVRALSDQATADALTLTTARETEDESPRDPARLTVQDREFCDWVRMAQPDLFREDHHADTRSRVVTYTLGAAGAFLLILFILLPQLANTLAELIPPEREAQLGRSTVRQIELLFGDDGESLRCEDAAAQIAWDAMAERFVDREAYDAPITVIVFDHPMVNAFAAPGGHVVFFRGLLDAAESPDEVAAVMAHEIAHVVARDPTRLALRSVGSIGLLGLVLGDFAGGGLVLALSEQLLNSSYSREAEAAADAYAIERMLEQDIDPTALGTLFSRLRDEYGDTEGFAENLSSHPSLSNRIAIADAAGAGLSGARPSVSDSTWQSMRSICDRRDVPFGGAPLLPE